jgi:PAS domain S-box-containing protein
MARSLQQVEASYKGIVEDQPDLICRYKNDGKITFVNGAYARAVNRKRNELVGVDFPYFAPGAAIADEPYTFESEMVFNDGRRLWIRWTQRAIKDDERNTMEYQAVGHDITERKEAEAALLRAKEAAEAADRAKSEFLAIVSHELRTPINAIIGFSKMLSSTTLNLDQREQVEMINSSGLALEKIIADILNLSKIDSGKIDIEHAPFSLRACVQDICAFFAPKARSLALGLDSKVDPGVPEIVNSDESRIRQILTNLIGNALKFTERGGVSLEVSCARGRARRAGLPPPGRAPFLRRQGHRDRHPRRQARPPLPALQPGRRLLDPPARRHGPRPHHLQAPVRAHGGHDLGREPRQRGLDLPLLDPDGLRGGLNGASRGPLEYLPAEADAPRPTRSAARPEHLAGLEVPLEDSWTSRGSRPAHRAGERRGPRRRVAERRLGVGASLPARSHLM